MKFTFNFMTDIKECDRSTDAVPKAMHPLIVSKFYLASTEGAKGGHTHVASIASSGFNYLAEIEEGAKKIEAFGEASHFAFRNTFTILVDSRWIADSGDLTDEASNDLTIFIANYIAVAYGIKWAVGIQLKRTPDGFLSEDGVDSVAFLCHALMPVPEEEWERVLTVRQMEVTWAQTYLANRKACADVEVAGILNKFAGKLH